MKDWTSCNNELPIIVFKLITKECRQMNERIIFLYLFIATQIGISQTFDQKLRADVKQGIISETQALFIRALKSFAPDRIPDNYRGLTALPLKSSTSLLVQIRSRWNDFSPDQRSILQFLLSRPNLPESYVTPSGLFKIHYATTGYNAVSPDDLDYSGIPDYIEEISNSFDYVYTVEVEQLGFNPPPSDDNTDGPEWDVYIKNIDAYGYTYWETEVPGNPNRWTTYITIDNDYTHTPTEGLNGARVTAAHEFFHMVQFGYYFRESDIFLMEAASTWMEDVVYDHINDYYYYLPGFFNGMNKRFDYSDFLREYGLCVWFHFLEKRLGTRNIVREVWEQIDNYPSVEAIDMALRSRGHTFEEELSLFYGWNIMTGYRADTTRFYSEGHNYPLVRLDASYQFLTDTVLTGEIKPTAARYFQFYQDDGSRYTFSPTYLNRDDEVTFGEFSLSLIHGTGFPFYTNLGNNVQTRLIAEDFLLWKCVAVAEIAGGETAFIPFSGNQLGFSEDDLPGNFPNPFLLSTHSVTSIPFLLESPGVVHILILRASGYKVKEEAASNSTSGMVRTSMAKPYPQGYTSTLLLWMANSSEETRLLLFDKL